MINKYERRKVNKEVRKKAVSNERKKVEGRKRGRNLIIGIIVIILLALAYVYFFIISPAFVIKPFIIKTDLASASDINSDHLEWAMNEMNAYKLHSYLGNEPIIEIVITDQDRTFTTTTTNNYPSTEGGAAVNPDIRLSMNSADFVELYAAADFMAKVQELRAQDKIQIEILKNDMTLAMKGYKAIYDALPGASWQ